MNKANVLVISIVFLVMFSFVVIALEDEVESYGEMTREQKQEFLEKYVGKGINPDDAYIDAQGRAVITGGNAVFLTSYTRLPVVLNGGNLFVSPYGQEPYTGTIEVQEGGYIQGINGLFDFGEGGTVIIVDGVVQFQNVYITYGHINGLLIYGKDISYDGIDYIISREEIIIGKVIYTPVSEKVIYYDLSSGIVDTKDDWIVIKRWRGYDTPTKLIGKLKGSAEVRDDDSILLIVSEESQTEFENFIGTKIKVSSETWVGTNYNDIPSKEISTITYSDRFKDDSLIYNIYVNAIGKNKIEIETNDGDYDEFIVKQDGESEIKLVLEKDNSNKGIFYFKEGKQLEKGSIEWFETNIIHVFEDDYQRPENEPGISTFLYDRIVSLPTSVLDKFTRNYGKGLKALAHYLGGFGEPMEVDLSKEDWEELIVQTEGREWTPNTNPEYHADDGWEHMNKIYGGGKSGAMNDAWNLLGETTLRRRRIEGGYHYMIAGETFDFIGGVAERVGTYNRIVKKRTADFAKEFFPNLVSVTQIEGFEIVQLSVNTRWLQEHGKPFEIVGEYIKKD